MRKVNTPEMSLSGEKGNADSFPQSSSAPAHTVGLTQVLAMLGRDLDAQRSVLLTGPAGVGKTHLARVAAADQTSRGRQLVEILGMSSSASVPLGPCAHLVPPLIGSVPVAALIAATLEALRCRSATTPVIVLADDVDLLDDASAILVADLVDVSGVAVLGTVRDPVRLPRPLAGLFRQSRLPIRAVRPLAPEAVAELSCLLADGQLGAESARRVYQATGGNPLWVTELLRAAVSRHALQSGPEGLRLDIASAVGGLDLVITERLDGLAPEERDAMELLAVAGTLPVGLLEKMVGLSPPETLAAIGLLSVRGFGEALTARLSHPLHRDCLLEKIDGIHRRSLLRRLVAATVENGQSDPATLVRLSLWHAELGEAFEPGALGWAARTVHGGMFDLVRRHLAGERTTGEDDAGLALGLQSSKDRSDASRRLAISAWRAEPTFDNGLALARALLLRSDLADEMAQVLESLRALAATDEDRAWLAVIEGYWLFWIVGDRQGAWLTLDRAQELLVAPWYQVVASTRGGLEIQSGSIASGVARLARAVPDEGAPVAVRLAHASPMSGGLTLSGRMLDGLALAEQALPLAIGQGNDGTTAMGEILMSSMWAKLGLGRYEELRTDCRALADLLADADDDEGGALFGGLEARCVLFQGKPETAGRLAAEAIRRHGPLSLYGARSMIHSTLAWALAWSGQPGQALVEMVEARRWHEAPRFFDAELDIVEALALAGMGRRTRALTLATRARDEAIRLGGWYYAYLAAHLVVRLLPTAKSLAVLKSAAARVDGATAALAIGHGEALVTGEAQSLRAVAQRAVEQGERLLALEMIESAATLGNDSAPRILRSRLESELRQLRADCEGARSPLTVGGAAPQVLTARESEIVTLAAQEWTSAAIAEELVISVRTVESHLYRAFAKLGVRHRGELGLFLGLPAE